MNFLKSLYRKLFGIKTGAYHSLEWYAQNDPDNHEAHLLASRTYDPSTDENKIMNGEVESYFE